jgi:hypothetical protein
VDRLGFGQCLGADEVEARENPSRLAAQMFIQPHNEAGYTSAVVTGDPDPADLLQSGGVHIRPHMAHCVVSLRCNAVRRSVCITGAWFSDSGR